MNTQETSFYNNVTGFSPSAIKRIFKKESTNEVKFWILKAELGKELMKARDYYNSEEGKNEMDDAGITYNDICEFFQTITNGRMKKSPAYKRIKVYENIASNPSAPKLFVEAIEKAKEENPNVKTSKNDESFNYFCANGELKINGVTATANETTETESEETEETESEENQSEDGTFITISMKSVLGFSGATIRIDTDGNVLQADGDIETLLRNVKRSAMPLYNPS
jgi:hypothetical protein